MTVNWFRKLIQRKKHRRLLAFIALPGMLFLPISSPAAAVEIRTEISKVDQAGEIEMPLPKGAMVAIGDKVHVIWPQNDSPNGSSGEAAEGVKSHWTVKTLTGNSIVAIPMNDMPAKPKIGFLVRIDTLANQPIAKGDAPTQVMETSEGPQSTVSGEAAPELTTPDPVAKASDLHACDSLAAHMFDPDAKAKGVSYEQLDAPKVIEVCQKAIDLFPDASRFYGQLARGLHKAGRMDAAYQATHKGAELGSGHSMAYLGILYRQGQAVAKDLAQSLIWFDKAAEKGNPAAMMFAAAMYRDGTATDRNYARAAALYKQAAALDIAEAMTNLAVFLDRGQGSEKNAEESALYFLKALKHQDEEARKLLYEAPGALSIATRKQLQHHLKQAGFYKGPIDGDFGTGTRNALTLYRRAK